MKLYISAIIPAYATQSFTYETHSDMRQKGIDIGAEFLYRVYTPWTTKAANADYTLTSLLTHKHCDIIKDCDISTGKITLTQHLNVRVETVVDIQLPDEIDARIKQFIKSVFGRTFRRVIIDENKYRGIDSKSLPPFKLTRSVKDCKKLEVEIL